MSAFVVSKEHVDLMVRAALRAHPSLCWWRVDENGDYLGWRELDRGAEHRAGDEHKQYYTPSQLGQILVSENVASVAHRYSQAGHASYYGSEAAAAMDELDPDAGELPGPVDAYYMGPYIYTDPGRDLTPGEVFRAIDCLDYQSCEHPSWRRSEAFAFLTALREVYCQCVSGYEDAPWEFSA